MEDLVQGLQTLQANPPPAPTAVDGATIETLAGDGSAERLVLINGRRSADLSSTTPPTSIAGTLGLGSTTSTCPTESYLDPEGWDWFLAANRASADDVAAIAVPAGASCEPVHVVHVAAPGGAWGVANHPTMVIRVEPGATATVIESYIGLDGPAIANASTTIEMAAGSTLSYHRVEQGAQGSAHNGNVSVLAGSGAHLRASSFTMGASTTRVAWSIATAGDASSVELDGLALAGPGDHHDHFVTIDHRRSHTTSRQQFREIVAERARAAFTGQVLVRPGTVGTSAHQHNASLLLDPTAEADARPWLEIDADDVRCSHGATVGQLDQDALFYLRSRGIPEAEARTLLVEAFAREVLEAVDVHWLREHLFDQISHHRSRDEAAS